jgi:RNA polymerase sigma-70 factor, ECF subfamily
MKSATDSGFDVEPHLGVLRRYALVLTRDGDQAEDLVQEALLRAIAGAATWLPGADLRPWLLSIVHNTHVSRRRRRLVEAAGAAELAAAGGAAVAPPVQLHRVELAQTVAALWGLPDDQREVLALVAIDGLSYKDAAEILGVPLGTLMSRLARARAALRRAVGGGDAAAGGGGRRPALRVVK